MKFLFLYTRLPDYFLQCVKHLLAVIPQAQAWIVHYDSDNDAPFVHDTNNPLLKFVSKSAFDPAVLDATFRPDLIYIAGWADPLYKSVAISRVKKIPVVMGLDNPWTGHWRQWVGVLLAPWLVRKYCNAMWVAGKPQFTYARKLGFKSSRIITGLYCANTIGIEPRIEQYKAKRILYVGRLVQYKRPDWLLKAFVELVGCEPDVKDWKLTIIGNGPLREKLQSEYGSHEIIEFISFLSPYEVKQQYSRCSFFCLPSHQEHWGVVVQEAAAAGLPLLLSTTCGAATEFLRNGENGFLFNSNSYDDFRNRLFSLMKTDSTELRNMGTISQQLSKRITHDTWLQGLQSLLIGRKR